MAEARHDGSEAVKEAAAEVERQHERTAQAAQHQVERVADLGREGMRRATDASSAAAVGAAGAGAAMADCAQEITSAWSRYAEDVMRNTSEASRALVRARTFSEMLEVQAKLLRDNMQSFLDQSVKIAEVAGRMAARPFEALQAASSEQTRR